MAARAEGDPSFRWDDEGRESANALIADVPHIRQLRAMIAAAMLIAAVLQAHSCDLGTATTARAVHEALGHRAVEIVSLASAKDAKADERLSAYIDEAADFDLGAGDVGRPLGSGIAGAHSLAATMKADQFRYLGWDYMDGPSNACGKQSITVDFIDTADSEISQVDFTFDRGRVIAAKGWQRSFESGPLASRPIAGNVR